MQVIQEKMTLADSETWADLVDLVDSETWADLADLENKVHSVAFPQFRNWWINWRNAKRTAMNIRSNAEERKRLGVGITRNIVPVEILFHSVILVVDLDHLLVDSDHNLLADSEIWADLADNLVDFVIQLRDLAHLPVDSET
jgi:hypothetical protein